jgi:hypothetical protein
MGRTGARPIPPATTTASPPQPTGHEVPNGPRIPRVSARQIAALTAPTARTVRRSGGPLTEIGTSPIPNA